MTDDLVAFLRARYDEALARENGRRSIPRSLGFEWTHHYGLDGEYIELGGGRRMDPDEFYQQYGEPAADPFTVADLNAKRQILKLHDRLPDGSFCVTCDAPSGTPGEPHGCPTLRLLALPYADHPDYRPKWRP